MAATILFAEVISAFTLNTHRSIELVKQVNYVVASSKIVVEDDIDVVLENTNKLITIRER